MREVSAGTTGTRWLPPTPMWGTPCLPPLLIEKWDGGEGRMGAMLAAWK